MSDVLDKLSGGQILGFVAIVSGAIYLSIEAVAKSWSRVRRAESEAALKRDLVAAGKSAEEIEQVVQATAGKRKSCPPELLTAACDSMATLNAYVVAPMRECGAHAATDVTGFGLAGHAFEMAEGSHTTVVLDLKALPLFPGADRIDVTQFRTRASKTNREYTEADTHFDGTPDPWKLEFFYDAQTSGGLLISVPADRAAELVRQLTAAGAPVAVVVGEVVSRRDQALWVK